MRLRGSERDTIAAIASPPGPGERGVVRISGVRAGAILEQVFRSSPAPGTAAGEHPAAHDDPHGPRGPRRAPAARGVWRGRLDDGRGTQPCLLLWMPGPRSYTREDVAELHLPGSPPLLAAALRRVLELGARAAEPGEFTRRAFENGRLDLTRAEGVLELVRARTDDERRAASALLCGGLDERLTALRERLEGLRALCEASLDFDETDTGHVPVEQLLARADDVAERLADAARWEARRAPQSGLPRLVLVGAPNAGKSALFNALVEQGRALVADLAGTTRDGVGAELDLAGLTVSLLDAPGLEEGAEDPDRRAQVLARAERESADLCLWVADASTTSPAGLREQARELPPGVPRVLVWSKCDLAAARPLPAAGEREGLGVLSAHPVSSATGEGLRELRAALASTLGQAPGDAAGRAGPAAAPRADLGRELSARHRSALDRAREEVDRARAGLRSGAPLDQVAEILRGATDALDAIGGRTTPEDLLDRIFASFCIGK